jgi:hypothetical protein
MNNSTTIYLFSEDPKLKAWTDLFCKNLSMITAHFFGTKDSIEIKIFNGELTTSDKHIFLLTEDAVQLNIAHPSQHLFQVHLTPIPFHKIPSFLQEAPLFEFYDTDATNNKHTWSNLETNTGNSWEKLLDFSKRILNIYSRNKQTIYLAKTSAHQKGNRDLLKQDLLTQGFNVIPETPLNDSSAEALEKQVNSFANEAALSIHIYGNDSIDTTQEIEIVDFQNKIFSKNKHIQSRLIWLPTDVILDKNNEEKISILRKDLDLLKGAEFVEAPLELFKSLIYQNIETISTQNKNTKNGIYFIYDHKENQDVEKIKAAITKQNLEVLVVDQLDEHPLIHHKKNLAYSNGIIIYYDGSNNNWIENILNDIIKAPKYRNNKQINAIGIVSNSAINLKPELESYKLEQIDITNPTQLETFIQNINK